MGEVHPAGEGLLGRFPAPAVRERTRSDKEMKVRYTMCRKGTIRRGKYCMNGARAWRSREREESKNTDVSIAMI